MRAVLISTYELGHQPFGLASPAAWLRARGIDTICFDLSRESLREGPLREAGLIAFYVPMHTATRLATQLVPRVRSLNPRAHLCFYGLYAPVNADYLRGLGVSTVIGGEFEQRLAELAVHLRAVSDGGDQADSVDSVQVARSGSRQICDFVSLDRLRFLVPDRAGLPPLRQYAHLLLPEGGYRVAGYTEASRGCKHLCRHCPVVPVYNGNFRIVPREIVCEDIRRQVSSGAEHITFGDPDFFNGPAHALAVVDALHREFPRVTYDVTIKIEHLLRHAAHLRALRDTGCLFVTSAVESVDDAILARLDKGHTRADFLEVVGLFREMGLVLQPTFVPFTPWTTLQGYRDLLAVIAERKLVENVAPIQLGIRLLIPAGSRLLELKEMTDSIGAFDPAALAYPWRHTDARMDPLAQQVQDLAGAAEASKLSRTDVFSRIWLAAYNAGGHSEEHEAATNLPFGSRADREQLAADRGIPHFTEPWYCCAEPTRDQFISIAAAPAPAPQPPDGYV